MGTHRLPWVPGSRLLVLSLGYDVLLCFHLLKTCPDTLFKRHNKQTHTENNCFSASTRHTVLLGVPLPTGLLYPPHTPSGWVSRVSREGTSASLSDLWLQIQINEAKRVFSVNVCISLKMLRAHVGLGRGGPQLDLYKHKPALFLTFESHPGNLSDVFGLAFHGECIVENRGVYPRSRAD